MLKKRQIWPFGVSFGSWGSALIDENDLRGASHIGAEFVAVRKSKQLTQMDVAETLNIQSRYIDAIERLDKEPLPSMGYALGYVRSYARFLGLDENDAIRRFKRDIDMPQNFGISGNPRYVPKRRVGLPRGSMAIGGVLASALVVFSWYGMRPDAVSATPVIQTVEKLEVVAPAPVTKISSHADTISLKAIGPSWVEVVDKDGQVLISRIMVPGEVFETDRQARPVLSLRDAGSIEVYVGGNRIGPIGQKGVNAQNINLVEAVAQ